MRVMPPYAAVAFTGLKWRFKSPIKIGDTIHVKARVTGKRDTEKPDRGVVVLGRTVLNQRGEVVQEGETEVMVERRGPAAS
jgi:acyl dehydratase